MPPRPGGNMHIPPNVSGNFGENSFKMKNAEIIYQSKNPINFYIGLITVLLMAIYFGLKIPFPEFMIYPGLVFILWFITISRYACRVQIYEDRILVKYIGFWHLDKVIELKNQISMTIRTPIWSFNLNHDSETFRGHIFYDSIVFEDINHNYQEVRINTRIGQLSKVVKVLRAILRKSPIN